MRAWLLLVVVGSAACGANIRPTVSRAPSAAVDTLDFVIGEASSWPRTGTQRQHQIVDRAKREVCWVKYGRSDMFECWRWDDAWIYHEIDHAIDGETAASYAFSDARWLPRHMMFGRAWSLDVHRNTLKWWAPGCVMNVARAQPFPYLQHAWLEPARYVSADLGVREVLVLEYEPYDPAWSATASRAGRTTHPEVFEFARGAGWFAWSSDRGQAIFDQVGGPVVARSAACTEAGCR
jgi:hypothetical protein